MLARGAVRERAEFAGERAGGVLAGALRGARSRCRLTPAGSGSETATLWAVEGPLLLTLNVQTIWLPVTTLAGAVLTTARSAAGPVCSSAEPRALAGSGSPVVLVASAVFVISLFGDRHCDTCV